MKYLVQKDKLRRLGCAKFESENLVFRSLLKNQFLSFEVRAVLYKKHLTMANSSFVRIKNRCVVTGRAGSVYRKVRLSRLSFRELANGGWIAGVSRSSW